MWIYCSGGEKQTNREQGGDVLLPTEYVTTSIYQLRNAQLFGRVRG
jgi:hypothetical protein